MYNAKDYTRIRVIVWTDGHNEFFVSCYRVPVTTTLYVLGNRCTRTTFSLQACSSLVAEAGRQDSAISRDDGGSWGLIHIFRSLEKQPCSCACSTARTMSCSRIWSPNDANRAKLLCTVLRLGGSERSSRPQCSSACDRTLSQLEGSFSQPDACRSVPSAPRNTFAST